MSSFVIYEIVGLFVSTLTANDKYCVRNCVDLLQPTEMELSKKQIFFLNCYCNFQNLNQSFSIFKKR